MSDLTPEAILPVVRAVSQALPRLGAEREAEMVRSLAQVTSLTGDASRYHNGILVSESGFQVLRSLASHPTPYPTDNTFAAIPIYTAPDWTFDLGTVAMLRLRVTLLDRWAGPLLRRVARWFR